MTLPTPNTGESEQDFISRCMGNDTMNEDFPGQEQRSAVCYKQWRGEKANALKAISRTDDELRVANYIVLFGGKDIEGYGYGRASAAHQYLKRRHELCWATGTEAR